MFRALSLSLLLSFLPAVAFAQARVSIEDLTVDGDPPPDEYRTMLANGIRPQLEEIRTAYGRRLSERPGVAGDYRLRLWVSAREVVRITPESSIGDPTLEQQVRDAIYRFHLPPEAPDGGAWVRFTVRFVAPTSGPGSAGSASTGSTAGAGTGTGSTTTPPAGTGSSVLGSVPPLGAAVVLPARVPSVHVDRIRGALAETAFLDTMPVPALASCLGAPHGTMIFSVSINRRGAVAASPQSGGTLRHRATLRCVERAIEALSFAPEAGPTRARITITVPPAP